MFAIHDHQQEKRLSSRIRFSEREDVDVRDDSQQIDHSLSSHRLPQCPTLDPTFELLIADKSSSIKADMSRKRTGEAADSAQVDGDKKAGYESKMQMDDMPIDWVEQVLSFLPLTDVYKCKSVCKAWHVAADRVLSDWETLGMRKEKPYRWALDQNKIFLQDDADCRTWIKRLKRLVRLKKIFVPDCYFRSKLRAIVDDVVLRNASTLTLLRMRSGWLPFDPKRPVVFHNLRDLDCSMVEIDQAAACLRLEKLRTSIPVKGLQKLPAETLTYLSINGLKFESGSPEEIGQLVAALSRFTRLKSLILVGNYGFFHDQWTNLHDQAFRKLFTNMKELEEVDITFPEHGVVNVNEAIETLVHSPSVRSIRMIYARMTDAGLRSLSRLKGLQRLDIRSYKRYSNMTTEGILSLLRGGSRSVLRDLDLNMSVSPDLDQIRAEVDLMQEETGRTFKVEAGPVSSAEGLTRYNLGICLMVA